MCQGPIHVSAWLVLMRACAKTQTIDTATFKVQPVLLRSPVWLRGTHPMKPVAVATMTLMQWWTI